MELYLCSFLVLPGSIQDPTVLSSPKMSRSTFLSTIKVHERSNRLMVPLL